jgi:D-beta-D-heptose 7-phosphate kinase / D-beta-D-heptose 1-phosphate adenosyltransferase
MSPRRTGPLVVVGDALLDIDVEGTATRLCPDAPVPVVDDPEETPRPGGAALAAELAARDGHDVVLVTAVGDDEAGRRLADLLSPSVRLVRLGYDGETPVKKRIRAGRQSLLRLDSGRAGRISDAEGAVAEALGAASAVLVSDYGRGVTALPELRRMLDELDGVPLVWDPHPRGRKPVPGARLVTPNDAEAAFFAEQYDVDLDDATGLAVQQRRAVCLVRAWRAHAVAITLGGKGALLSHGESAPALVPGRPVDPADSCGAGDRFSVSAALDLARGAVTSEAVQTAVATAARFVAEGGAGSVRPARKPVLVATGGCFDLLHAGHVATLRAARDLGDRLVVCLNSDASVRRLKGPTRPVVPQEDRIRVLEALECVDEVVVFEEATPVEALRKIRPDIWAKGGDYAGTEVAETAVLQEWGGQAVVLPYLEGRSTTLTIERSIR